MFPVGGTGWMLLGAAVGAILAVGLSLVLSRRLGGVTAVAIAGLLWWLAVIALVTLLPTSSDPGIVPASDHATSCSWDIGGPAPDGFWIFAGGQRLLNTMLFVPAGALLVVAVARWRAGWVLVPLGLVALAAYSLGIELTQLQLARLDRACDVTDIIDNVTGAALGVGAGLALALVLRPWRARRARR